MWQRNYRPNINHRTLSKQQWSYHLPSRFFLSSYVLRYAAMQLRSLLHAKFPNVPEDDILKVVGNLFYHRYMNPAIVAPDRFDIVDVGMEQQLSPNQVNEGFFIRLTTSNGPNVTGSIPFKGKQ